MVQARVRVQVPKNILQLVFRKKTNGIIKQRFKRSIFYKFGTVIENI